VLVITAVSDAKQTHQYLKNSTLASPRTQTKNLLAEFWRAVLSAPVLQQPNEEQELQLTPGPGTGQVPSWPGIFSLPSAVCYHSCQIYGSVRWTVLRSKTDQGK